MENTLSSGTLLFQEAIEYDENGILNKALESYNKCKRVFLDLENSRKIQLPSSKDEIQNVIIICETRVRELELILLKHARKSKNNYTNIINEKPIIKFNDVCGMKEVKEELKLSIFSSIKYPEIFSETAEPFKSFLLYGV